MREQNRKKFSRRSYHNLEIFHLPLDGLNRDSVYGEFKGIGIETFKK